MKIWLDAHLPPRLRLWLSENYAIEAQTVQELGLRTARDLDIYRRAASEDAIIMSKDSDYAELSSIFSSPPQIILLTCGNTSNAELREILSHTLEDALRLIDQGEPLVEISDPSVPLRRLY